MADEETAQDKTAEKPAEPEVDPAAVAAAAEKARLKAEIRDLKKARATAIEAKDAVALKKTRRSIHALKRKVRKVVV